MAKSIFISYGHDKNAAFADSLSKHLRNDGYDVFFDMDKLKAGCPWADYIEEGIEKLVSDKENSCFILIMTEYSVRRPDGFCLNELARAVDCGVRIVPIMLESVPQPLIIYRLQYLDMTNSSNKEIVTKSFENEYEKIRRIIEDVSALEMEGNYLSLEKDLNPIDIGSDVIFSNTEFVGRERYFEAIANWVNNVSDIENVFVIWGKPGVGKTAFAAQLASRIPNVIGFYRFRRNYKRQSTFTNAITTIAYQISTQIPNYRAVLLRKKIHKLISECSDNELFEELISSPLRKSGIDKPLTIIIDGLDEAEWVDNQNDAAWQISNLQSSLPAGIKLIVTSRPESYIKGLFKTGIEIDPSGNDSESDIAEYVDNKLGKYKQEEDYDKIRRYIIEQSAGVFLFAVKICEEIVAGRIPFDKVIELPINVSNFYEEFFRNRFKDLAFYRSHVAPVLEVEAACGAPLKIDFLKELLNNEDEYILHDSISRLDGLFNINKDNQLVSCHVSLIDWLCDSMTNRLFYISRKKGINRFISHFQEYMEEVMEIKFNSFAAYHLIDRIVREKHKGYNCVGFIIDVAYMFTEAAEYGRLIELYDWLYNTIEIFLEEDERNKAGWHPDLESIIVVP